MTEELTPEDVERPGFTIRPEGYDRDEVDVFLRDVAEQLRPKPSDPEKPFTAMGEEIGELLQVARAVADRIKTEAETDARKAIQDARLHGQKLLDEAERTKRDLQRQVDDARIKAETDTENFLAQAEHQKRLAEAEMEVVRQQGQRESKRMTDDAKHHAAEIRAKAEAAATEQTEQAQKYVRRLQQAEAVLMQRMEDLKEQVAKAERDADAAIEAARKKTPKPAVAKENGSAKEAAAKKEPATPGRIVRIGE
jgi:DivIVA domain-containing protein